MQYRCPHCQNELQVDDDSQRTSLDCDVCGSTFLSDPDATQAYDSCSIIVSFAHYELLEEVGRGAYGTVWKAHDTRLDRIVAVKIPRADQLSQEDVDCFLLEAQAAAQLRHPGIVGIYDTGRADENVYIATEFIDGMTLSDWLRSKKVSPRMAAEVCAQSADALHHAHECGIIHRDIKPSNILLDDQDRPYLTDFGLAKRESVDTTIATDGSLLGTPAYMSPEQARGEAHWVDRRSDIYSLGVVLFELLTGERPFRGSRQMILRHVIETDSPNPQRLNSNVPDDLATICLKCLEKLPARRYESASELADELRRWLRGEPIRARPITRTKRVWRWCQRNPVVAGLTTSLILALILGLVGVSTQWRRANANAVSAMAEAQRTRDAAAMAETAREQTEQYLYVAHMNMVQQAYELADPQRAVNILDLHRPEHHDGVDRRGFEWFYWWRQTHRWSKSLQHTTPLNAVAISPDGSMTATAGADGTISLWDTVSGEQQHSLKGHEGEVFAIAFSPTKKSVLVSTGRDQTMRIWDLDTRKELAKHDLDRALFSVAFSVDGSTLALGGADSLVHIWDTDPLQERHRLTGHFDFVYAVAISPDGTHVGSTGLDRTVRIWDTQTGEQKHALEGHDLEVWSIAFSPDGRTLATGGADHTVRLWDVEKGEAITALDGHTDRIRAIAFSPDGKSLVSAGHDRTIRLWDITSKSQPLQVPFRDTDRRDAHFFERMQLPNSGFPKDDFKGHLGDITAVAWSKNGRTMATASVDGSARLWNVSELEKRSSLRNHTKTINAVAVSRNGRSMLSGSNDRTARFWDLATMRQVGQPIQHDQMVLAVALSPDDRMFATGSYDGRIRIGPLDSSQPTEIDAHERAVSSVAFSRDSKLLASGSHDGSVRIWDVETGQPRFTFSSHDDRVQAVLFLPDGSIASSGADKIIRIWDPGTGESKHELVRHESSVWSLSVSDDGTLLASGSADNTIRIWDLRQDGKLLGTFEGHAEPVRCVAFSPHGRTLASGSDDKTIKLWDIDSGEPKTTLKGHKYRVWSLGFASEGDQLLSASLSIRVWNAPRELSRE